MVKRCRSVLLSLHASAFKPDLSIVDLIGEEQLLVESLANKLKVLVAEAAVAPVDNSVDTIGACLQISIHYPQDVGPALNNSIWSQD